MKCTQDEMPCIISQDCESLERVKELYFRMRENDGNQEADDSPLDDSSSESKDDYEGITCSDVSEIDLSEKAKVEKFVAETCNCKLAESEKPCSTTISFGHFRDTRNNFHELSSMELDLVVLGLIQSSLSCGEVSALGRSEKQHKKTQVVFFFQGQRICKETFLFLYCLSQTQFFSLVKHYKKNRLTLRVHGNKKQLPSSSLSAETVENVVKFILNVTEEQALLLPGRIPGFKQADVKLLPSVLPICYTPGALRIGVLGCLNRRQDEHLLSSSLFDIATAVEESACVNVAELIGLHNGTVLVSHYDWTTYLGQYFKKLPEIKSYYHFRFHKDCPGTIFYKKHWVSKGKAINILRNKEVPVAGHLPATIPPRGISRERAEYLYKEIREFCRDGTEDFVAAPLPQWELYFALQLNNYYLYNVLVTYFVMM